jgi:N-methylhydantoinase A
MVATTRLRLGIDTGGTFTDCVYLQGGQLRRIKVFSTPAGPSRAILQAARQAWEQTGASAAGLELVHGTTVGTNSLLERRGGKVALVTTEGFEDVIAIGRQARPRLYDLAVEREPELVAADLRFGLEERTSAEGRILRRPAAAQLRELARKLRRRRPDAVAVCFLFSFMNPANEETVAHSLRRAGFAVCASHEILPEFREFERTATVVMNAFLAPRVGHYLQRLEAGLKAQMENGGLGKSGWGAGSGSAASVLPARPMPRKRVAGLRMPLPRGRRALQAMSQRARVYVMQSSGGITTAARAAREPVRTILSGPAGGVVAAAELARRLGIGRALSFDMGGTSTDVSVIEGEPRTTSETVLAGLPVAVPVLDVHSVGAGGGSIARIDAGGALRVGPESAGAAPGPACYGRGGTQPTVTDANLALGRLRAENFLGGTFKLDRQAAGESLRGLLRQARNFHRGSATPALTVEGLAEGVIAVANSTMERALRVMTVERGRDPRDYTLICFGGAGGAHAAALAQSLGMRAVVIPPDPGTFSALGILLSNVVRSASHTVLLPAPCAAQRSQTLARFCRQLETQFSALAARARAELEQDGFGGARASLTRTLDMRYRGQSYELQVPYTRRFLPAFHREHEKVYGHAQPGRAVEVVNLRVRLELATPKPAFKRLRPKRQSAAAARADSVRTWFENSPVTARVFERGRLSPGMRLAGPAIITEYSSTTFVPPRCFCRVDEYGNLILEGWRKEGR